MLSGCRGSRSQGTRELAKIRRQKLLGKRNANVAKDGCRVWNRVQNRMVEKVVDDLMGWKGLGRVKYRKRVRTGPYLCHWTKLAMLPKAEMEPKECGFN